MIGLRGIAILRISAMPAVYGSVVLWQDVPEEAEEVTHVSVTYTSRKGEKIEFGFDKEASSTLAPNYCDCPSIISNRIYLHVG